MFEGIISLLSGVASAVSNFFGYQSKRLDLKNSPQMEKASETQKELAACDKTSSAIAQKDSDEIRKEIAE